MNTQATSIVMLALSAGIVTAQERPSEFDARRALQTWEPPKWELPAAEPLPPLKLGKSDYSVSGPLIDTFRLKPRENEERSLGRKLLDLPIINIFVPEPMPRPTRQGAYFAWGNRDVPWAVTAERSISGPVGVLVSVSR